jgi:mRNA interferase MazF
VQADHLNTGFDQKLVALITSNLRKTGETRIIIAKESATGRRMGLLNDSVIVADNIATVQGREMDKVIGNCADMGAVDEALRITLGLQG